MKVSIVTITYNHEKYIAQAIESVLMQEVDFEYEIVIGEDCSQDRTREIVIDFQKRYPDKIRLLLPQENLGGYRNFVQTLSACRGEYIAILDGDDYWTSPHKLQKQADLLDRRPDYALCFHNVVRFYEDGSKAPENNCPDEMPEFLTLEDLLSKRSYTLPVAVMYRKGLVEAELPPGFRHLEIADWPRFVLIAQHGKIGYINEVMGVYRIHSGGIFSQGGWTEDKRIRVGLAQLACYEAVNHYFDYRYDHLIRKRVADVSCAIGKAYGKQENWKEMWRYLFRGFRAEPFNDYLSAGYLAQALLKSCLPGVYRRIVQAKQSGKKLVIKA